MAANYVKFLKGTPNAFNTLTYKDPNTLYFIIAEGSNVGKLYLGNVLVAGNVTEDGTEIVDTLGELLDVEINNAAIGQVLGYNGTAWIPMDLPQAFEASILKGASEHEAGQAGYVPAP